VDENLFEKGLAIFRGFKDRAWSFTDCTSFALMKQLGVNDSFAFDEHFKQAGFTVFP
jgi:predicted nucleic acid-binding protein